MDDHIKDLIGYVKSKNMDISDEALEIFIKAESIGKLLNIDLYYQVYLMALIEEYKPLRGVMLRSGKSPEAAFDFLNKKAEENGYDDYEGSPLYSDEGFRGSCKAIFIDSVLAVTTRNKRIKILNQDLLEGLLELQDEESPPIENGSWADEKLHVPFNTLSHINGTYCENLWIKFEDIRDELAILRPDIARAVPLDIAPHHVKGALLSFFADNPDFYKNVFLIMPFRETPFHKEIVTSLRGCLEELGYKPLRADDKPYSEDVLSNIEAYIHGSRFCIAVHERMLSDDHNPNVALEIGYVLGMKKKVCLLKEKTVKALPSDLQGRIYVEFNASNIKDSITQSIKRWISNNGMNI